MKINPSPPNEQLNLTLYPGAHLACAKPRPSVKRKLTRNLKELVSRTEAAKVAIETSYTQM